MRFPFALALRETLRICRRPYSSRMIAAAMITALRGAPWVIRRRCVLPKDVLHLYRMLQTQQHQDGYGNLPADLLVEEISPANFHLAWFSTETFCLNGQKLLLSRMPQNQVIAWKASTSWIGSP